MRGERETSSQHGGGVFRSSRDWVLLLIFLAAALILVGRLFWVQIVQGSEYSEAAEDQRTRNIVLPAERGTIYDRNGNVLATTVDATTIYANPKEISEPSQTADTLAAVLGGEPADYIDKLTNTDSSFVYIKRKADTDVASQLEAYNLAGIYFLDDTKRVYPYNGVGGQIIGVTDADDNGISGLELEYDDALSGEPGLLVVQRGLDNTPMSDGTVTQVDAVDGQDIIISIDIQLQQHAEEVLRQALADNNATNGAIIVYDGATGEIYAAASAPMLSTENWRDSEADAYTLKNITYPYEPGSTFKAVTASSLLDAGVITPETEISIPGSLSIDDFTIRDVEDHGDTTYTLREIIAHSSNIGTVLASQRLDRASYYNYLVSYGFGQKTGVDFPGESSGYLLDLDSWSSATAANVPFGQGISVTQLQLVRAYGAFTNEGVLNTPHFLLGIMHADEQQEWETTQVISPEAAAQTTDILESVVTDGGGYHGAMDHYTVAAKTGTAQISQNGSYLPDTYNISYCGYLPNSGSQLICLVTVETKEGTKLGPYFADVMGFAADLYQLTPDK